MSDSAYGIMPSPRDVLKSNVREVNKTIQKKLLVPILQSLGYADRQLPENYAAGLHDYFGNHNTDISDSWAMSVFKRSTLEENKNLLTLYFLVEMEDDNPWVSLNYGIRWTDSESRHVPVLDRKFISKIYRPGEDLGKKDFIPEKKSVKDILERFEKLDPVAKPEWASD